MGIPAFFRWVSKKCPSAIQNAVQVKDAKFSDPNPNDIEYDCLYLDLNGVIHQASHPDDRPPPETQEEMFEVACASLDNLLLLVRPRKLIYMALDGVAPRAKMNQQRSRRFKSGAERDPADVTTFDHNVITPGTEFMQDVGRALADYAARWVSSEGFEGAVVVSDTSVPGEGEHKIMEFMRRQQTSEDYDPNLRHVIYGADADLIMLGLALHEPKVYIVREVVGKRNRAPPVSITGFPLFCFVNITLVRFGLIKLLKPAEHVPFWDDSGAINDFIFLAFFVGNDFLPTIPGLNIRDGALDMLLRFYRDALVKSDGFITSGGEIDFSRAEPLIHKISESEDELYWKSRKYRFGDWRCSVCSQHNYASQNLCYNSTCTESKPKTNLVATGAKLKDMYYAEKFGSNDKATVAGVVRSYTEGLAWVFRYYFQGCPSWEWYYPQHYAPFASDLVGLQDVPSMELGAPFLPLQQLMSVLPPQSADALPKKYKELMKPPSAVAQYYPLHFELDQDGFSQPWMAVVVLPFISAPVLKAALLEVEGTLTEEERARNAPGFDRVFVSSTHPLAKVIGRAKTGKVLHTKWREGLVCGTFERLEFPNNKAAVCAKYANPEYPKGHVWRSGPLPGAVFKVEDLQSPSIEFDLFPEDEDEDEDQDATAAAAFDFAPLALPSAVLACLAAAVLLARSPSL